MLLNNIAVHEFPKYIWDSKTGKLIICETGCEFINPSEYCDGSLTFNTVEEAEQFLRQSNLKGNLGIKLTSN